jgi:ABC-type nitrate/sulfonate/bicarbonate transport system substrate-binding protein
MSKNLSALLALAFGFLPGQAAAAGEKIRIGYWSSGFSLGIGAVLEAKSFFQRQGLDPEFVSFADVNGPSKAIVSHSIDAAFGAPTTGIFSLAVQGAPIKLVLATQIAEATFVVRADSPIRRLEDLAGKKIGTSAAGSTVNAIAIAVLDHNHGLNANDYMIVPGSEARLAQLLRQGELDAAALRAVTIAQMQDTSLRPVGGLIDEWQKMTGGKAAPVIGAAVVDADYARDHETATIAFTAGLIEATRWGADNPGEVARILSAAAGLGAEDAQSYAALWPRIYMASLLPQDVATFEDMASVFRTAGMLDKSLPSGFIDNEYFVKAMQSLK